ncbi:MAG TPA: hypothetical protein VIJ50_03595 [Solirubrobacteraceae bacterium]
MTVAVSCAMALLSGLAAAAYATPWEARGAEPSAAEQLGLKRPEGQGEGSSSLSQTVATTPSGAGLFAFDYDAGLFNGQCRRSAGSGYLGFRNPNGSLRLLGRLPALTTPPVIGGGREALVVFTLDCKRHSILPFSGALERLRLRTGPLGRRPTTDTVLSSTAEEQLTTIAANPSGDLAVAWLAPSGRVGVGIPEPTDLLHLSIGRTSGSMGSPVVFGVDGVGPRMSNPFFTNVRIAWTGHRELIVAYVVDSAVMVQTWRPRHGLSRSQAIGGVNPGQGTYLNLAVGPGGRAVIAWGTHEDNIEPESPRKVFASVRTGTGVRFGVAHQLDPGPVTGGHYSGFGGKVQTHVSSDGFTTVAWASEKGDGASVCVAVVDPSGHFQPVQELAPDSANLTLTSAPGGGTVLQWEVTEWYRRFTLSQATRQPGAVSFAPAEASALRLGVLDGAELIDSATGE